MSQPKHYLSVSINADAFTGLELGYRQEYSWLNRKWEPYITLNVPFLRSVLTGSMNTWEIKLGSQVEVLNQNKMVLLADANLFLMHHNQNLGRFMPFGVSASLIPALKTKKGYLGVMLGFNQTLATHIKHSDYVKERFNEIIDQNGNPIELGPKDGFYALTGHALKYGIAGRFGLGHKSSLYFDLGMIDYLSPFSQGFNAMMFGQLPFYMDLRWRWRIGA